MAQFNTYYDANFIPASTDIILMSDTNDSNKVKGCYPTKLPVSTATQTALNNNNNTGLHLRTFIKKARDYRSNKTFAESPKIVMIGDSILTGAWSAAFKSWLSQEYYIHLDDIEIHKYAAQSIDDMIPFIEDIAIFPNPDLIVWGEYGGAYDTRNWATENIINYFEKGQQQILLYTHGR